MIMMVIVSMPGMIVGARRARHRRPDGCACSARMNPPPLVQTSRAPNAAIRA
jgi:hypothetical protein